MQGCKALTISEEYFIFMDLGLEPLAVLNLGTASAAKVDEQKKNKEMTKHS
jgi:hypothetical protein